MTVSVAWKSIKDELPENGQRVAVLIPKKSKPHYLTMALFVANPPRFYVNRFADKGVKFWMEIPSEPTDILEEIIEIKNKLGNG